MPKHIIQTINFNLLQEEVPLISNLNWTVDESEWVEIKGSNNSGKTSLLNAMYGHINQCSGQLFVLDFSMTPVSKDDLASLRRKLGFAKQESNLLKNKTVRANLAMVLNAADRIMDQNYEEIIITLLDRLSLKDSLRKEIKDLSYSQQLLASIARALIHRPKLLLLDQSLDCLDNASRHTVIEIIQEYRNTERMTIISTSVLGWSAEIANCKPVLLENLRFGNS
jgi:cell division transport system ATP-binding protein